MFDLAEIIRQHEGKTLEFKRDLSSPDKVMRTLVAFANGAGGRLLIGVEDPAMSSENRGDTASVGRNATERLLTIHQLISAWRYWCVRHTGRAVNPVVASDCRVLPE
jgi:predicted HTH transcriptional regulator